MKGFFSTTFGNLRQLKSRHPFVPAALALLNDFVQSGVSVTRWADNRWNMEWRETSSRLHAFITDVSSMPSGMTFPRAAWVRLNRLRTGVGLFRSTMHKWGMASTAACECGAEEQTAEHIMTSCPLYCHPNGASALSTVDEGLVAWLTDVCPAI